MDEIMLNLFAQHEGELKKHIEAAFEKHFGFSIYDIDLKEINHLTSDCDPIESFVYHNETFLYIQQEPGTIDNCGAEVKVTFTTYFKEV